MNADNKPYDPSNFKSVFETHKDRVFNTVLSLLQHQQDAEDVTQEVFVRAYETMADFKGDAKISTWLYRIAVNTSINHLKAKKTKKRSGFLVSIFGDKSEAKPLDIPDFVHPGVQLERRERATRLFKAIDDLSENQKIAFTLSKIEGLPYAEIAEVMKITIPSVESLLFRAKQNLQKSLKTFYEHF